MSLASQFRRWFEYEQASHAKVISSLTAVPESLRASDAYQQALTLLAHICAARELWLKRLGATADAPGEFFPRVASTADVEARLLRMERAWSDHLAGLTDGQLSRVFEYRSQEGDWYRNTIQDVLTQLYGHSLYHRGQISALLRSIGCEPAATDFIFWTRELMPEPAVGSGHGTQRLGAG